MTLQEHLAQNHDAIMAEAREYAKNYKVDFKTALRDVKDEYIQGYADAMTHPDHMFEGRE